MFIRNSWYVAAWSEDIKCRQPFARTILGEPVALFRTSEGRVAAFEDRCAHRGMPLSLGQVTEDDRLVCAYHGLTYDEQGVCVRVPGQPSTQGIRLRTYPVEERWGLVWIWMGAPERADAAAIFDCSGLERPGWRQIRVYRHVKAHYVLINDNLADLLHLAYLHRPSGAGNESMGPARTELQLKETGYHFVRETLDIPSPTRYARGANAKGNVDRWHVVDYQAPSFFRIHTGVAETGTGGPASTLPQGQGRWTIVPYHLITPETQTTTHYFQVVSYEWAPSADSWNWSTQVLDEDVWAIENQQRNRDLRPEAPMTAIPSDAPMLAMHKIIARMLQAEARGGVPALAHAPLMPSY